MNRLVALVIAFGLFAVPIAAQDIPLSKILVEKEGWRAAMKGWRGVTYMQGGLDGGIWVNRGGAHGTFFPDGKTEPGPSILIIRTAEMALASNRRKYAVELNGSAIECFEEDGKRRDTRKLPGLKWGTCVCLWPDEGHLVIGESDGAYLWAVRIEKDGSFGPGDRYYSLRTKPNEKMHVSAMTMDAGYLLYACTPLGIQVFDPTGRLSGVIAAPSKEPMSAITIGGAKADELFVAAGDKIFARKIQGKASYTLKKEK
jgi:sugar lactone lactonase YvrE